MNRPKILPTETTDEEILAGVRSHLVEAEQLVPQPPRWTRATTAPQVRPVRSTLRPRFALGGFAPLILIVVVVALALGYYGLGPRGAGPGAAVPTSNLSGALVNITYRVAPTDGHQPSEAELNGDVSALSKRLSFIFPMTADPSGNPVLVAGLAQGYDVTAVAPDEIVVRFQADYRLVAGALVEDDGWIRASIGLTGNVEIVGSPDLPKAGTSVAAETRLLGPADIEGSEGIVESSDAGTYYGITLTSAAGQRLATYASTNQGTYVAVLVDGRVFATTSTSAPDADGVLRIPIGAGLSAENAGTLQLLLANGPLPTPVSEIAFYLSLGSFAPQQTPSGQAATPTQILAPTMPAGVPTSGRTLGDPAAPVTIDVWADYQCAACKVFADSIEPQLVSSYVATGEAKLVYHDLIVIDAHTGGHESLDGANAARCAADQNQFWSYHELLFGLQQSEGSGAFSKQALEGIASNSPIDLTTFTQCVENGTHDNEVGTESASSNANGTPSLTINGAPVSTTDYATIAAAIDRALGSSSSALPSAAAQPSRYAPSTAGATTTPVPSSSPAAQSSPTAASSGAG